MYETEEDIAELQALIDRSYSQAGKHLVAIHDPTRRVPAVRVADRLQGMCLLVLATVTADGRPLTGPVDGIFYRGSFYFGSSPDSVRFRHIGKRPQVSATHLPGEEFAVSVHGHAEVIELADPATRDFQDARMGVYRSIYGDDFDYPGGVTARIVADRFFAFNLEPTPPNNADR
ncbi:MAG: pyridoxamine 5'-phosphate oxidase family protein [Acidimicrobiales bacterium]